MVNCFSDIIFNICICDLISCFFYGVLCIVYCDVQICFFDYCDVIKVVIYCYYIFYCKVEFFRNFCKGCGFINVKCVDFNVCWV